MFKIKIKKTTEFVNSLKEYIAVVARNCYFYLQQKWIMAARNL